jgi:hypothetical protein
MMLFTFAGRLSGENGPAANPATIQSATASVICSGKSKALGALVLTEAFLA